MAVKNIDARGRSCPEPVVMTKKALDAYDHGIVRVLVDTEVSKENVTRFAKSKGFSVTVTEKEEEFELELKINR